MGQLSILAVVLAFVGTLLLQTGSRTTTNANTNEAIAIAGNMMVYRNAVSLYAHDNPTASGTLSDSAFSLPTWYQRISGVGHYLNTGTAYIYYSTTRPELAYQVVKSTNNAITVGIKRGGYLINPLSTTNYSQPVALPSAIPEESVVYAF